MILYLSSLLTSAEQDAVLARHLGKEPRDTQVAYIENAYDVYNDEESLIQGREELKAKGYVVELVDLRNYRDDRSDLREKLANKDMFLFTGGNPFYLRWIMKETGADQIITELVHQGKVYAGASAGAVVAGPTLRYFDNQDDPNEAGEIIWDGLHLTDIVVVPHIDNEEFGEGCRAAGEQLKKEGYPTQFITDAQVLLIVNGQPQVL